MFKDNTIGKRVMEIIKTRIETAQKKYDEGVKELEAKLEDDKNLLADKHVSDILGKVL